MRVVLGLLAFISFGFANAAEVRSAELSYDGKYLILGTVHGGGCGTHDFSFGIAKCTRDVPGTCTVQLIHKSNDPCEALIGSTVVFDLEKERMTGTPGATLRVLGSGNSEVSVILKAKR